LNLKKNGKVFTSISVGTGPSSYEKIIYRSLDSQKLRNAALVDMLLKAFLTLALGVGKTHRHSDPRTGLNRP